MVTNQDLWSENGTGIVVGRNRGKESWPGRNGPTTQSFLTVWTTCLGRVRKRSILPKTQDTVIKNAERDNAAVSKRMLLELEWIESSNMSACESDLCNRSFLGIVGGF